MPPAFKANAHAHTFIHGSTLLTHTQLQTTSSSPSLGAISLGDSLTAFPLATALVVQVFHDFQVEHWIVVHTTRHMHTAMQSFASQHAHHCPRLCRIKYTNMKEAAARGEIEEEALSPLDEDEPLLPTNATIIPTVCGRPLSYCMAALLSDIKCGHVLLRRNGCSCLSHQPTPPRPLYPTVAAPVWCLAPGDRMSQTHLSPVGLLQAVTEVLLELCLVQVPVEIAVWSLGSYRLKGVTELMRVVQVVPVSLERRMYPLTHGALNKVWSVHVCMDMCKTTHFFHHMHSLWCGWVESRIAYQAQHWRQCVLHPIRSKHKLWASPAATAVHLRGETAAPLPVVSCS